MEWLLNRVVFVSGLLETALAALARAGRRKQTTAQVHIVYFWMMHYNKKSPKRSMMLSNMSSISMLDLGVLTKKQRDIPDRLETTCILVGKPCSHPSVWGQACIRTAHVS